MRTTFDGESLFDEQDLEIESASFRRDSIERAVAGLDGVLSIDLGGRGRQIKQAGMLQARSRTRMNERIAAISACMDGDTHALVTSNGDRFDDLRMDAFKVANERASGSGLVVDYEIIYTQLSV
jgi:hypothetical protein